MTPTRQSARFSWRSLRTQLIFWNVLALAILLAGLGLVIRYTVVATMISSVDRELDSRTRRGPRDGPGRPPPPLDGRFRRDPRFQGRRPFPLDADDRYRPRRFDRTGKLAEPFGSGSDNASLLDPRAFARALHGGQPVFATVTVNGERLRVLYRPSPSQPPFEGVVQVPYSLTEVDRAIGGLNRALLVLVPVALLCAGAGGAALTDQVLRRVRRLAQSAAGIGAGGFSERLPVVGGDEFADLARTFNDLLSRLETAFRQQTRLVEQQRRFTADASHELKTPLTIIKGNTSFALAEGGEEATYRQSLQEIDRAADTMSHLVGDLLLLARSDEGQLGRGRVDLPLREILERSLAQATRQGTATPVRLASADADLRVMGNEAELIRLFGNLLDNALRHTPSGGGVTLDAVQNGSQIVVTVADTGTGIAAKHLPHLGERFYRVDDARSRPDGGTGLGLSICRGIVEGHGGTITFQSQIGVGTTVLVTLPAT